MGETSFLPTKMAQILSSDPNIVKNWQKFYDGLKLPYSDSVSLRRRHQNGIITNYELFLSILEQWKSRCGNEATVQSLETVLLGLGLKITQRSEAPLYLKPSDIAKITKVLSNNHSVIRNWKQVCDALELSPVNVYEISKGYNNGSITSYELFKHILQLWISRNGREATETKLESILRNLGMVAVAEQLSKRMDGFKSLPDTVKRESTITFPIRFNCEEPPTKYIHRLDLEEEILSALTKNLNNKCRLKCPVVILHGLGGSGKTTLARKFCQQYIELFKNIIWINAKSGESIADEFSELFTLSNDRVGNIQATLNSFYFSQLNNRRCLLIFDSVSDYKILENYLPLEHETNVSILITSNFIWDSYSYGGVSYISVEAFLIEEFSEFLDNIVPNVSPFEIQTLGDYTGRIPFLANIVCLGFAQWKRYYRDGDIKEYFTLTENELFNSFQNSPEIIVEGQLKFIKKHYTENGENACKVLCILAYCNNEIEKSWLDNLAIKHEELKFSSLTNLDFALNILVEQGFLGKKDNFYDYSKFKLHGFYQIPIQNILRQKEKEAKKIKHLLRSDLGYEAVNALNYPMLWEVGRKYGDSMLEEMVKSSHFLINLKGNEVYDGVNYLIEFAKRSGDKKKYFSWILFGRHRQESLDIGEVEERVRELLGPYYEDFELFFGNFGEFIEGIKYFFGESELKQIFLDRFDIHRFAVKKVSYLEILRENFPGLLHSKIGYNKETFLHTAAKEGNLEAVQYLISEGLDINARDKRRKTPLQIVGNVNRLEIVEMLLKAGADPNSQDENGNTALHMAAEYCRWDLAKLLTANKADQKIKNNSGKTAFDLAKNDENFPKPEGFWGFWSWFK